MKARSFERIGGYVWAVLLIATHVSFAAHAQSAAQPTEKEAAAFGERLAAAFNERDLKAIEGLIDFRELGMRAGKDVAPSAAELKQFAEGVQRMAPNRLMSRLFEVLDKSEGIVSMMRVVQRDGDARAILRFDYGDEGADYAEYIVKRQGSTLRAVDWYQLTTGELISATLGVVSRMLIDPNPGILKSLFGVVDTDRALAKQFIRLGELQREGKLKEALALVDKLPPQVAESRIVMVVAVNLASATQDDDLYRKYLGRLAQKHSNDPATSFMLIDHYFFTGEIEKVIRTIEVMEGRVGRDGLTEMLKANMYIAKGDHQKALARALESVRLEPSREAGYFPVATAYTALGNFADAVKTYQTLESKFGYQFVRANFAEDPVNAKFRQSSEFKAWLTK